MLPAVLLGHRHDQLLADVAREVEVDVGDGLELAVEEASKRELGFDRIDVREPREVADDRADRASTPPPRRKDVARDRRAPDLERDLAGQLEHLPVQKEEPGQTELADQRELLVQAGAGPFLVAVRAAVPLIERAVADARQLRDRGLVAVREVRVAVAELLGQVELEARRELAGASDRSRIVGEALRHRGRREEHALVISSPLPLAAVQRGSMLDRDERVLQRRPARVVRMHVAGRDRSHAECFGEITECRVPPRVPALVRTLELDEETLRPEGSCQLGRPVRKTDCQAQSRASGQAHEPLVQFLQQPLVERRRKRVRPLLRPGVRECRRNEPAEVGVAPRRLHQHGHVRPVRQRQLGAGDRTDAERLRRMRELERTVQPVVVGERERLVPELGRLDGQLLR